MTYNEIINIAKRLDDETKERIDQEVAERLEILKLGDLNEEQMESMEECLYMSLVIQEYLDGEYELIDEERAFLLEEMAELYGEYNDLLLKAKLEEKVSKKKRLALELMRIREKLFKYKDRMHDVKEDMKTNRQNKKDLDDLTNKKKMKEVAKDNKKGKRGLDNDSGRVKQNKGAVGGQTGNVELAQQLGRSTDALDYIVNKVNERNQSTNLKETKENYKRNVDENGTSRGVENIMNSIGERIGSFDNKDRLSEQTKTAIGNYIMNGVFDDIYKNESNRLK